VSSSEHCSAVCVGAICQLRVALWVWKTV